MRYKKESAVWGHKRGEARGARGLFRRIDSVPARRVALLLQKRRTALRCKEEKALRSKTMRRACH
jgi:hypothetical protein